MKIGATLSSAAHIAILTWGMLSFQSPREFIVAEPEAVSVDIIPIEETTKTVEGDEKAQKRDKPAPKPTEKPVVEEKAVNTGEAKTDIKTDVAAPPKDAPVEKPVTSAQAQPEPTPPEPEVKPEISEAKEETPVPTNKLASLNEAPAPVAESKVEPEQAKSETGEEFAKLPDNVPVPKSRPEPPKPKVAKTKERKKPEEVTKKKSSADADKEQSTEDKIAALLNKEDAAASGAKRSQQQASLGGKKGKGEKLSRSEMDALRGAIERCWNVPIGISDAEDMRVTITMNLAKDGGVDGRPKVDATGGEARARRAFAESARRAVLKCAPYNLPIDKYDTWSQVVVNFDPSQMF